jgi:hypothetical protein
MWRAGNLIECRRRRRARSPTRLLAVGRQRTRKSYPIYYWPPAGRRAAPTLSGSDGSRPAGRLARAARLTNGRRRIKAAHQMSRERAKKIEFGSSRRRPEVDWIELNQVAVMNPAGRSSRVSPRAPAWPLGDGRALLIRILFRSRRVGDIHRARQPSRRPPALDVLLAPSMAAGTVWPAAARGPSPGGRPSCAPAPPSGPAEIISAACRCAAAARSASHTSRRVYVVPRARTNLMNWPTEIFVASAIRAGRPPSGAAANRRLFVSVWLARVSCRPSCKLKAAARRPNGANSSHRPDTTLEARS